MENLTSSIISGFALLQNLLYVPQQHIYPQTGYGNFNPTQQDGMPYYHHRPSVLSPAVGGAYHRHRKVIFVGGHNPRAKLGNIPLLNFFTFFTHTKSNQHAKHAYARGIWRLPPRKIR